MKLHEVVAVRSGIKSRTHAEATKIYQTLSKSDLFNGLTREYEPVSDDGERFPPESKLVQATAEDLLRHFKLVRTEFLDIEITQEANNQDASADVIVDGETILTDVPVGFLIFLEKELDEWFSFIKKIPTLDDTKFWTQEETSDIARSETVTTVKTRKVQRPVVLYPATDKHPAQTQLVSEDETIGHWKTTHLSGAMPIPEKRQLMERVAQLQIAVKQARARANELVVTKRQVAGDLFHYLLR